MNSGFTVEIGKGRLAPADAVARCWEARASGLHCEAGASQRVEPGGSVSQRHHQA